MPDFNSAYCGDDILNILRPQYMKVLNVSSHFSKYVTRLAQVYRKSGVVTKEVLRENNYASEIGLEKTDDPFVCLELLEFQNIRYPFKMLSCIKKLSKIEKDFSPDAIHLQETNNDSQNIWAIFFSNTPLVLTIHDVSPHPGTDARVSRRQKIYRYLLLRKAKIIFVHGEELRRAACCKWPSIIDKVRVTAHPIFFPNPECKNKTADNVSFVRQKPIFSMVGRMERYKGLDLFCDAARNIVSKRLNAEFRIAGTGTELKKVDIDFESITVLDKFLTAHEFESEIEAADVIVTPYIEGSQSGILSSAVGHSKCIITSNVGSLADYVDNEVNGFVIDDISVNSLQAAMEYLIINKSKISDMGFSCAKVVEDRFSDDKISESLLRAYRAAGIF